MKMIDTALLDIFSGIFFYIFTVCLAFGSKPAFTTASFNVKLLIRLRKRTVLFIKNQGIIGFSVRKFDVVTGVSNINIHYNILVCFEPKWKNVFANPFFST